MAAASDPVVCDGQVEDQAPAPGCIPKVAPDAVGLRWPFPGAESGPCVQLSEERAQNSDGPVMRFGCARVCRCSRIGRAALVAAGEGGEYWHLKTQCRADERFPQRLIPMELQAFIFECFFFYLIGPYVPLGQPRMVRADC